MKTAPNQQASTNLAGSQLSALEAERYELVRGQRRRAKFICFLMRNDRLNRFCGTRAALFGPVTDCYRKVEELLDAIASAITALKTRSCTQATIDPLMRHLESRRDEAVASMRLFYDGNLIWTIRSNLWRSKKPLASDGRMEGLRAAASDEFDWMSPARRELFDLGKGLLWEYRKFEYENRKSYFMINDAAISDPGCMETRTLERKSNAISYDLRIMTFIIEGWLTSLIDPDITDEAALAEFQTETIRELFDGLDDKIESDVPRIASWLTKHSRGRPEMDTASVTAFSSAEGQS